MTDLQPVTAHRPPSPDFIRRLIGGDLPELAAARVTRMHFPSGRPMQIHFRDDQGAWIAEWLGEDVLARADTERDRLERLGQVACLRADAGLGLLARPPGTDAKLPGLRLMSDSAFAADQLSRLGVKGPFRIELAAHRLGKRAVLRIRHAGGTAYARLRSPGATQARLAAERHAALWSALQDDPRLRLPEPLADDSSLGLTLYRAVSGATPRFQGLRGFVEIEAISRGLQALQSTTLEAPQHTVSDEVSILRGWHLRLQNIDAALADDVAPLIDKVETGLASLAPQPPVLCHRDLHEGQILIHRGLAGFLDFDTVRMGDAALDIGNLQAHLVLLGLRRNRSLAGYITAMERLFPNVSLDRITLWRNAALLRLAMMLSFTAEDPAVPLALVARAE